MGNEPSPSHSSHYQNFSIFPRLRGTGEIRPRGMEEAVLLILISTEKEAYFSCFLKY